MSERLFLTRRSVGWTLRDFAFLQTIGATEEPNRATLTLVDAEAAVRAAIEGG